MQIKINTAKEVKPTIYAYTTPGVTYHDGWTKIGYTERDVQIRINEQTRTAGIIFNLEWTGDAIFNGEPRKIFNDKDFHAYLNKLGVKNNLEWFEVTGETSQKYFYEFKDNRGVLKNFSAMPYNLREEQQIAIEKTLKYFNEHENGEFLWNAKPRFGKTLAVYDFCKQINAQSVLIVTNRPAIANSWYDDYVKFLGDEWLFVSEVDALKDKDKKFVLSRADFQDELFNHDDARCIEFVSLQDMKGSKFFGGELNKLAEVADMNWDILVVDEAHEGVDTFKTDVAFDQIKRKFTLHLSGTPFKALANNKFPQDAIFNWTYTDEQSKKISFGDDENNPYAELPRLNLYTYQMSEIVRDELKGGFELDGTAAEYAFDLNEFFRTEGGKFFYDSSVDKFLDALTTQKKFPFSTPELRDELKHTFWLLNRVDSARALAKKLEVHPIFKDYEIILAAGDGKIDDDDENKKSYDKVVDAIKNHERTITLSVGQLTTGVTIPEWTGVLMLANLHSPALYIQAAFRAQNSCLFQRGENFLRKENSYVFDFDPARTLTIFEAFANDLASDTSGGRGNLENRQENIRELLNFFPVIGEDEQGELIELDAEKVLSIPRKIRSVEVVRRGFMSDFLFQNISRVFNASAEVVEIISQFPVAEELTLQEKVRDVKENLFIDDAGEISLPNEYVIGKAADIFGEKIYSNVKPNARATKKFLKDEIKTALDIAQKNYGKDLSKKERDKLERQLKDKAETLVKKTFKSHELDQIKIEHKREEALKNPGERSIEEINAEFDELKQKVEENFQAELPTKINEFIKSAEEDTVEHVETKIQETKKNSVEEDIRKHLRGFSRTIPSFLMAYGDIDNPVTLDTFDKIIPDEVFKELTSITLEQFCYLRDVGKLFDEVTFNDSVKEFLRLRRELADYFDEGHDEDIFDYIPPQKNNQIFTPRETVQKMLDLIEAENPGCFDDPDKTFIDLYMKSGTFAAEVVKRLYRSSRLKELFPDKAQRLNHIFAAQVYGLAPTEIIFRIAKNYILGFGIKIDKHNFRRADALPYAKDDKLDELLRELYD